MEKEIENHPGVEPECLKVWLTVHIMQSTQVYSISEAAEYFKPDILDIRLGEMGRGKGPQSRIPSRRKIFVTTARNVIQESELLDSWPEVHSLVPRLLHFRTWYWSCTCDTYLCSGRAWEQDYELQSLSIVLWVLFNPLCLSWWWSCSGEHPCRLQHGRRWRWNQLLHTLVDLSLCNSRVISVCTYTQCFQAVDSTL